MPLSLLVSGPTARAEKLSPEDFVALRRMLTEAIDGGVLLRACAKVNYALGAGLAGGRMPRDLERVAERLARRRELEIERSKEASSRLSFEPEGVEIGPVEESRRLQGLGVALGDLRPRAPDEDTASQEDTRRGGSGWRIRGGRGGGSGRRERAFRPGTQTPSNCGRSGQGSGPTFLLPLRRHRAGRGGGDPDPPSRAASPPAS